MTDDRPTWTRTIEGRVDRLADATAFVEQCADASGIDLARPMAPALVLEEVFVNVCHHAMPNGTGLVELRCFRDGDVFVLEVEDSGPPFDPLSRPAPDTTTDLVTRNVGGLGLHLIRSVSDGLEYRREADRNVLRIEFRGRPMG